jgi:uncharacterized protein
MTVLRRTKAELDELKKASAAGDPEAIWSLAQCHEDGVVDARGRQLVRRDPRKAVELYRKGAALGHAESMNGLAVLLSSGAGVRKDLREALRWETRGARAGDAVAAENAGISCKQLGNHRAAVRWFRRAIAMGNESGLLELAKAQLWAQGTRRNVAQALVNLQQVTTSKWVSEWEREEARLLLAYVHLDGWLVPRSYRDAVRWFREAKRHGSVVARDLLQDLASPDA